MNTIIVSNGKIMTAWSYGKPVLAWSRVKRQIVNPYDRQPISHATMLEFTTLVERGGK